MYVYVLTEYLALTWIWRYQPGQISDLMPIYKITNVMSSIWVNVKSYTPSLSLTLTHC